MHDNKWSNNNKIGQVVTMGGLVKMIFLRLVNLFIITLTWWDFETLITNLRHISLCDFKPFTWHNFPTWVLHNLHFSSNPQTIGKLTIIVLGFDAPMNGVPCFYIGEGLVILIGAYFTSPSHHTSKY